MSLTFLKKTFSGDFPGSPVVKNLSATAGDMGSTPGPGRSLRENKPVCYNHWAHILELLKPASPSSCGLQQEKSPQWEAHEQQLETSLHSLHLEKAWMQ